jgi:small subunit ribosomal protein S8
MSQCDLISDFLTRVRNASAAGLKFADIRWSKTVQDVAEVLKESNFIEHILVRNEDGMPRMRVFLKYGAKRKPIIRGLRRTSTPGCRRYVACDKIPSVMNGLGLAVVSTSRGVMSGTDAREKRVGGELMCYVW